MQILLPSCISILFLAACAAKPHQETYSIGSSSEILSYERARAVLTEGSKSDQGTPPSDRPFRILKAVPPIFPSEARDARLEGRVLLDVFVDEHGRVMKATPIGEPPKLFAEAAISAVSQWEFQPRMVNGAAVKARYRLPVNFLTSPPLSISPTLQNR